MLLPLPYLGATVTWTTCGCSQDCRNEASRPAAEKSGCGLAAPCSVRLWLGHCISYALANARIYIAAPVSAMPAVTSTVHSLAGFDQRSQTQAAIINSLGATKLRLVAPSALVPSQLSLLQATAIALPACLLPCLTTPSERSGVSLLGARREFVTPSLTTRLTHP